MYEKLGQSKGPSVVWKVVLAFLTPIFVFIASLVIAEKLLSGRLSERMLTLAAFFIALVITLIVVFIIRAIRRPHCERKYNQQR